MNLISEVKMKEKLDSLIIRYKSRCRLKIFDEKKIDAKFICKKNTNSVLFIPFKFNNYYYLKAQKLHLKLQKKTS